MRSEGILAVYNEQRDCDFVESETAQTIVSRFHKGGREPIVIQGHVARRGKDARQNGTGILEDGTTYTLDTVDVSAVATGHGIRRLTPIECERLQGFPDNWTKVPYRNRPADDCSKGPRYKACGNSMATHVIRWIGKRIQLDIER